MEGSYSDYNLDLIETNDVRCPDPDKAKEMADLIYKVKGEGDTIGGWTKGTVTLTLYNLWKNLVRNNSTAFFWKAEGH